MENNINPVIAPARGLYFGVFFAMLFNGGIAGLVITAMHFIK